MPRQCVVERIDFEGFEAFRLSNNSVSLTVVPALGGKITSILHLPTRREWLWRNPHLPYRAPVYGASFVEKFDLGGLDECFPSITPTVMSTHPWAGTSIPDHGELWCQPWEVQELSDKDEQVSVALSCHGIRLPYRFERVAAISAVRSTIQLSYALTNLSPYYLPFVWSIHPLLRIEPGMRMVLPECITTIRVASSTAPTMVKPGTLHAWPCIHGPDGQQINLSEVPAASWRQAYKLYTPPLTGSEPVEAVVYTPDRQHSLRFRFSPNQITHVALWMNYGGWSPLESVAPYFNLGFEPCIGGADSLSIALEDLGEFGQLAPLQTQRWELDLSVE